MAGGAVVSRSESKSEEEDDDGVICCLAPSFRGLRSSLLLAPFPTPARATAPSPRLPQPSPPRRRARRFLRRIGGSRERAVDLALTAGVSGGEFSWGL